MPMLSLPYIVRGLIVVCVALGVAAPARAGATVVRDANGRDVAVHDAGRIVSIGGAVTEILYALGLERRIVGVDTTSLYPERALKEKPNVGYMRALSPEGVLSLAPSLVLAVEGTGPKHAIAVLEAARVPFALVPDPHTGDGILEKIRIVAQAAGAEAEGACLEKAVRDDIDAPARIRSRIDRPARVMFVMSFVDGRALVAGRNTAADGIIALAGGENVIRDYEGYKPISDEAVIASKPDAVLAMQRSRNALTAGEVFAHAAFATTPAAQAKAFVAMDGLYLLGFGPRTALAARDLARALYGASGEDALPSERGAQIGSKCRR
jgi:iron complex transport system substrate-binding protein